MIKPIFSFLFLIQIVSSWGNNLFTFSGVFSDSIPSYFMIYGVGFEHKIIVAKDGSFRDSFPLNYNGRYSVLGYELYFEKGKNLDLKGSTLSSFHWIFEGSLSAENNYWRNKNNTILAFWQDYKTIAKMKEKPYLSWLKSQKEQLLTDFHHQKIDNPFFEQNEIQSVSFFYRYFEYTYYSRFFGTKLSKAKSLKEIERIYAFDINNEELYTFSSYYSSFCKRLFVKPDENFKPEENWTEQERHDYALNYLFKKRNTLKSSLIRDDIGYFIARTYISPKDSILGPKITNEIIRTTENLVIRNYLEKDLSLQTSIVSGNPAAPFKFINFYGDSVSSEEFRGKLVYIDVWATWCAPCMAQFPYFMDLKQKYASEKIAFVTISIDFLRDYEKWKQKVEEKGSQQNALFADKNWQSAFIQSFGIRAIPRFILIDQLGNIIQADAPQPSEEKEIRALIDAYLK